MIHYAEESKKGYYKFVGMFKLDKKHGFGIEVHADGTRYEGNFKEGKRDGIGKLTWLTKQVYDGEWDDNKMEGNGAF